jgi:hypothetical protein
MEYSPAKLSELKTPRKDVKSNYFQIKTGPTLGRSSLALTCVLTNSLSAGNNGFFGGFSGENIGAAPRGFESARRVTTFYLKIDFRHMTSCCRPSRVL